MSEKQKRPKGYWDVIYITRPQVERWTDEELRNNTNLPAAKKELEGRSKGGK